MTEQDKLLTLLRDCRPFIDDATVLNPSPHRLAVLASIDACLNRDNAPPEGEPLRFSYQNHRGEMSRRTATPVGVRWGATEWHPKPQWLLKAWCHDREAFREFALSDADFTDD